MSDAVVLIAEPRTDRGSGAAGRLRRAGRLPAVVYGRGGETATVTVSAHDLGIILASGMNSLITLRTDGKDQLALARQIQRDPTRGDLLHVDFVRVSVDVAIVADIELVLTGEAVGVKNGGLLDQHVFTVPIEAKPQDIPASVEFDVTHLDLGDHVRAADLTLPPGVTSGLDPETLLVSIAVPRGLTPGAAEGEEGGEAPEGAGAPAEAAEAAEDSEE
jgi:large subunit ribosomal protein L25